MRKSRPALFIVDPFIALLGTIVAMVVGAAVLFFKNDLQPAGLFRNYWDATLKSNSTYYPNIGNVESEES